MCNCVLINISDFKKKVELLSSAGEKAGRIAKRGHEFIRNKHKHSNRAASVSSVIREKLGEIVNREPDNRPFDYTEEINAR